MTYLSGTPIKLIVQIKFVFQTVCIWVLKSQSTAENFQNHPLCNSIEARVTMPGRHLSRLSAGFNLSDIRTKTPVSRSCAVSSLTEWARARCRTKAPLLINSGPKWDWTRVSRKGSTYCLFPTYDTSLWDPKWVLRFLSWYALEILVQPTLFPLLQHMQMSQLRSDQPYTGMR